MPIEGKLEELSLVDFLQILALNRKTGKIKVENELKKEKNSAEIIIKKGYLQLITILGDDLLYIKIKQTGLLRGLKEDLRFNEKEILILATEKSKDVSIIQKILRSVNETRMFEILSWKVGIFRFEELKNENEILPDLYSFDIQDILLESSRRLDEWEEISKKIPSYSLIPVLSDRWLNREIFSLDLSPLEWKILSLVDSKRKIEDIIEEFKLPSIEVAKEIVKLYERGIIEFKEIDRTLEEKARVEAEELFLKAREMLKKGKYLEAEVFLTKSISLYPDFIMAHLLLAELYYSQKNYRLASQQYYQIIRKDPHNPLGYYGMGFVRVRLGDLQGALKAWEKAFEYASGDLKSKIERLISLLRTLLIEIDTKKMPI
ncbi:MAG: DUF4388 domain-containing protein [Candidatus Hydrothermales bacterium]